jgi:autotransporter passenger strand-loop-strand repeat protein
VTIYTAPPNVRGVVLYGGDRLNVLSGGTADFTTVNSGGIENVNGGTADFTTVNSGGILNVFNGGTATSTTIFGLHGGRATRTTISAGGDLNVFSGGTATGTTIFSGGVENVQNGGLVVSTKLGTFLDFRNMQPTKFGNEVALNVKGSFMVPTSGGPGTGRTLYGQSGLQGQHGPVAGNQKPGVRDILSSFGPESSRPRNPER